MSNLSVIDDIITNALKEDFPGGDITTESIILDDEVSNASFLMKENGIVAGIDVCKRVFELLDKEVLFEKEVEDGTYAEKGTIIAQVSGRTKTLLMAERTALNIIQRMSGIATAANEYCQAVKNYNVSIVDTRKTVPGLRYLDKYAVRMGGGRNHRYCLSDGVLIKDNHIAAAGGITNAIDKVRKRVPHTMKIEVEVSNLDQVNEALECKADIIMLDNMDYGTMKKAVSIINRRALVEASGNITLDRVVNIAETGVDIISVGALTHSVKGLDISMKIT